MIFNGNMPRAAAAATGPPYPPKDQGLGGNPKVIPDIPISAVFLTLYLIFGIIHIKIFKGNKNRGHKFIFNGAMLGLCKIRIITMSLRMAWATHPRNISLAIAANVFVYVGTIILFMMNWFFVQRIIRAQHARLGWSTPYRIFHRAGLAVLIITLIMLIIANIWQFFTLDQEKLRVFRDLNLLGQTYFTVFAFAPAILVSISLLIPRHEIDKFGAGRLRINIMILLLAVTILSIGQVFRCVINWIPQTPSRDGSGRPVDAPWYLSKVCFYCFNFVTEIVVIILYAVVRVDLRFHIPNGSRMSGDYSNRSSRVLINQIDSQKDIAAPYPTIPTLYNYNSSTETLQLYKHSVFEDTRTLADTLKYESSTLEVDEKTGHWKVKRSSTGSRTSIQSSSRASQASTHDRSVRFTDETSVPPVPRIPGDSEWPLRSTHVIDRLQAVLEHRSSSSTRNTERQRFEICNHALNGADVNNAITDALSKLEQNSEKKKTDLVRPKSPPPAYRGVGYPSEKKSVLKNPLAPHKHATYPPKSALKTSSRNSGTSPPRDTPETTEAPKVPALPASVTTASLEAPAMKRTSTRPSSVEVISITRKPSTDSRLILDVSLQGDKAGGAESAETVKDTSLAPENEHAEGVIGVARAPSSAYSEDNGGTGLNTEQSSRYHTADEESERFSFESAKVAPLSARVP